VTAKLLALLKTVALASFGAKAERYSARHRLLSAAATRLDGRLVNKNVVWHRDQAFVELMRQFDPSYSKIRTRHYALYELAKSVRDIPGDTAECGVFRGASSFLILSTIRRTGKTHCLFDSFAGLSEPAAEDRPSDPVMRPWQGGELSVEESVVRENLAAFSNLCLLSGWIPDRFPEVADRRFSLVHVDVDLYRPTKESVLFFYERLSPGGMLVCDDYGFGSCPGAHRGMQEAMEGKPEPIVHLPTGQGLIIRR
jgi:hypothetical protein